MGRGFFLCAGALEHATAQQPAAIIKRANLPRGDGALRALEFQPQSAIGKRFHARRFRLGAVSRLGLDEPV
jgi:hypothetical protein